MQGWFTGNLWVDLFVRSWVEICWRHSFCMLLQSTSSWGRELKCTWSESQIIELSCRPPCEVVSWNYQNIDQAAVKRVDLLVRSWVERLDFPIFPKRHSGRPPCEVVSWNNCRTRRSVMPKMSTSSRGRELKYVCVECLHWWRRSRPPSEVVSWNNLQDEEVYWYA